jgi:DNA-binding CsgD family transcriptional regulator
VQDLQPYVRSAADVLDLGILLIDSTCRVLFANRTARKVLASHRGMSIANGMLLSDMPGWCEALRRQLRGAAVSRSHRGRMPAVICPGSRRNSPIILALRWTGHPAHQASDPATILFVADKTAKPSIDERAFARMYGLTRAETRLLRALLDGRTLRDHAARSGITLHTTKGYLKQLFGKTGARRQADLVRLALANPVLPLLSSVARADPD